MQKSYAFRGPDLDAASSATVASISIQLNDALKRFGSGWAVYTEIQSYMTAEYPGRSSQTVRPSSWMPRGKRPTPPTGSITQSPTTSPSSGSPRPMRCEKQKGFSIGKDDGEEQSIVEDVRKFVDVCDDVAGILSAKMDIQPLDDEETLSYLHSCPVPGLAPDPEAQRMMFLDRLLVDTRSAHRHRATSW